MKPPQMIPGPTLRYVYLFVRQDLPVAQQIVQTNHATMRMGEMHGYHGTPNIVLIGVPDKAALEGVSRKCAEFQIAHHIFFEPDFQYGYTAIATEIVEGEKRLAFAEYDSWKQFRISSSMAEQPVLSRSVQGSSPC